MWINELDSECRPFARNIERAIGHAATELGHEQFRAVMRSLIDRANNLAFLFESDDPDAWFDHIDNGDDGGEVGDSGGVVAGGNDGGG